MAKRRRIARMIPEGEHGRGDRTLQRAVDELCAALGAHVVYGFVIARDGDLHCVSVSPAEHVRAGNLTSAERPDVIELLCAGTAGVLAAWSDSDPAGAAVFIPWWDESGPIGAAVAVLDSAPAADVLRIAEAHGSSVGCGLSAGREHEHTLRRLRVLERLNEMLESAFAATSDAVMQFDLDGRVLRWNKACEELYGWTAEEIIGHPIPAWKASQRSAVFREMRAIAMSGVAQEYDVPQVTRDGAPIHVRMTVMPLQDEHGNPESLIAVARPLVAEIERSWPVISSANLGEIMIQELTSPLTAVIGYGHLLSRSAIIEDPEQRQRVIRGLRGRCEDLAALMEDLMLVARLDVAGLSPECVDLADTLRAVVERVGSEDCDPRFDPARITGTGHALVDRRRTERSIAGLLRCLARNCGQDATLEFALASDGTTTSLRIQTEEPDQGAARVLADWLESMSRDELPGEAGLGLHVARLVAEAHGGSVSMQRESPLVSSFTLHLPAATRLDPTEEEQWRTTMM